jgi:uncharacterized protein (DUF927 family)
MPTKTIGKEEEVVFQAISSSQLDYATGGTLAQWSTTIGALCQDNPAALFAISSALAGPLLKPLGKGGGGFHFIGDSSCGKTTTYRYGAISISRCGPA